MAFANVPTIARRRGGANPLSGAFSTLKARIGRARERARRYDRVYEELMAHRDRELADMGIARSEIPTIAKRAANAV